MVNSRKRLQIKAPAYEKLAITLPRELAGALRQEAAAKHASSLSAFIAEKLSDALEKDRLMELLDEMDAKYGPPGPEAEEWANEVLYGD